MLGRSPPPRTDDGSPRGASWRIVRGRRCSAFSTPVCAPVRGGRTDRARPQGPPVPRDGSGSCRAAAQASRGAGRMLGRSPPRGSTVVHPGASSSRIVRGRRRGAFRPPPAPPRAAAGPTVLGRRGRRPRGAVARPPHRSTGLARRRADAREISTRGSTVVRPGAPRRGSSGGAVAAPSDPRLRPRARRPDRPCSAAGAAGPAGR